MIPQILGPRGYNLMLISKPEIVRQGGEAVYSVRVTGSQGDKMLWYRVDAAYADFVSDRSDAALLALLIPSMAMHAVGKMTQAFHREEVRS